MGLFEVANNGTLFLDEIGELPLNIQVKLLRAIQERVIRMVGGTDDIKIDVRIVAATNRNLEEFVKSGGFREDLYYRLNVIHIKSPALRERRDDIPILAKHFLDKYNSRLAKGIKTISVEAMEVLKTYDYPGNVRELVHTLERVVNMVDADVIDWADLPPYVGLRRPAAAAPEPAAGPAGPLRERVEDTERQLIIDALRTSGGNKLQAAKRLGIHRSVLYRKMAKWSIQG
jgi:two-component system response regulator PilR (NtrC family)